MSYSKLLHPTHTTLSFTHLRLLNEALYNKIFFFLPVLIQMPADDKNKMLMNDLLRKMSEHEN